MEIKSIYNDTYEIVNENVEFCGDCMACKNMCNEGIRMVSKTYNVGA